jgi:hypothetical protein
VEEDEVSEKDPALEMSQEEYSQGTLDLLDKV